MASEAGLRAGEPYKPGKVLAEFLKDGERIEERLEDRISPDVTLGAHEDYVAMASAIAWMKAARDLLEAGAR